MPRHLVLVGLPGVGKSAVGRDVAEALAAPLFDIDQLDPRTVAGIEYFASAAQAPPELNATSAGTCGIVVIWTR